MVRERQPESPRPWGFNVEVARHVPATLRLIIYGALAKCRASCSQPQLSGSDSGNRLVRGRAEPRWKPRSDS